VTCAGMDLGGLTVPTEQVSEKTGLGRDRKRGGEEDMNADFYPAIERGT